MHEIRRGDVRGSNGTGRGTRDDKGMNVVIYGKYTANKWKCRGEMQCFVEILHTENVNRNRVTTWHYKKVSFEGKNCHPDNLDPILGLKLI